MLENEKIYAIAKPLIQNPLYARNYINFALQNQSEIQSDKLSGLLQIPAKGLLQSDVESDVTLALQAIASLKIDNTLQEIDKLINERTPYVILELAVVALGNDIKKSQDVFARILEHEKFNVNLRLISLHNLIKAGRTTVKKPAWEWIPSLKINEKQELVTQLSGSNEGATVLMELFKDSVIDISVFDISAAERIYNTNPKDTRGLAILEGVKLREEQEARAFEGRLAKYLAIAQEGEGNPKNGAVLFESCLGCHRVGNRGQDIAPSLDGSANREYEALLTAILDPDAAVENSYSVFRVTKKDGSVAEGYLVKRDNQGTTLAFMGGSRVFIKAEDIKNQRYLAGRSFMVKGLIDNYSDEQVADLFAYIRTLE
jgi:putative heme-binding domain-containing protein